jgi:hypothetical protein
MAAAAAMIRSRGGPGLSVVSAIATAHHASLDAQARPSGGLDVEVRFPCPMSYPES